MRMKLTDARRTAPPDACARPSIALSRARQYTHSRAPQAARAATTMLLSIVLLSLAGSHAIRPHTLGGYSYDAEFGSASSTGGVIDVNETDNTTAPCAFVVQPEPRGGPLRRARMRHMRFLHRQRRPLCRLVSADGALRSRALRVGSVPRLCALPTRLATVAACRTTGTASTSTSIGTAIAAAKSANLTAAALATAALATSKPTSRPASVATVAATTAIATPTLSTAAVDASAAALAALSTNAALITSIATATAAASIATALTASIATTKPTTALAANPTHPPPSPPSPPSSPPCA